MELLRYEIFYFMKLLHWVMLRYVTFTLHAATFYSNNDTTEKRFPFYNKYYKLYIVHFVEYSFRWEDSEEDRLKKNCESCR